MKNLSHFVVGAAFLTLLLAPVVTAQDNPPSNSGDPQVSDGLSQNLPVTLGRADDFVILARTGVSTLPYSLVIGSMGVCPADTSSITGFELTRDVTNLFSLSSQVTEGIYAPDYADPTPSKMTTAVDDMDAAYADAAGRTPDVTELGAGNIGGMTLTPGVYRWTTDVVVPTDMTLMGSDTDVWIFQIAENLVIGNGVRVRLFGGASARNIFWQVAGATTIETNSRFEGIVLGRTTITTQAYSVVNGGLYAHDAVNLDNTAVIKTFPAGVSAYGTGTPGCHGVLAMNASEAPRVGTSDFAFLCSNAPLEGHGIAILTDVQDVTGTFVDDLGILLHVGFLNYSDLKIYDLISRPFGVAVGRIPIPNEPSLEGRTFYTQCFWLEAPGEFCGNSPLGLLSSSGLTVTIQP